MDEAARGRLVAWLRERAGLTVSSVEPLGAAGRSNVHYRVVANGGPFVLRRPPETGRLPTAHDMAREHAVLSALWPRGVPVPRPVVLCTEADVLGVPFLLTEECPGTVVKGQWAAPYERPRARAGACAGLVAALATVHRVPWRDTPLREFDRPEPYATRQLRRLARQWSLAEGGADGLADEVRRGLAERFAATTLAHATTIVHGDYGLHNVVLAPAGGRVAAILDWELWTVGDPLADVAWLLALWAEPGDDPNRLDLLGPLALTAADGCWTRARLAEEYHRHTGADLTELSNHLALGYYKLGVILAGIAHRLRGRPGQEAQAGEFLRRAHIALRTALAELARPATPGTR